MNSLEIRCGLEIHAQLNFLKTKLFCSCKTDLISNTNENSCPICRGFPGSLPNINGTAVLYGLKLAKTLAMTPISTLKFSRKHYDYPDLPKGFQITQNMDGILGLNGFLPTKEGVFSIRQIQLEEDPARLSYVNDQTIVDYNRSGITLIELVTDPIFSYEDQIKSFLRQYRRLLYFLHISDTRMESSFRADVNVSVGAHPRVEVKNVGSDTDIIAAFNYEIFRQKSIVNYSNIGQETRNWDSVNKITTISRDKESSSDYKFIPEGNIPSIDISDSIINSIELPILPWNLEKELLYSYELEPYQLDFLLDSFDVVPVFQMIMNFMDLKSTTKNRFFWQDYLVWYNQKGKNMSGEQITRFENMNFTIIHKLLVKLETNSISNQKFKNILKKFIIDGKPLDSNDDIDNSDDYTQSIVDYLKKTYPQHFSEISQNPGKINYLVGLGVKYSKGKVNPKTLQKLLQY